MKKLLVSILMTLVVGVGAFAKQLTFETDQYWICITEGMEAEVFSDYSEERRIEILKNFIPEEIGNCRTVYMGHYISTEVEELVAKYNYYFAVRKDGLAGYIAQSLGGGKTLYLNFALVEKESK